jgi:hypothetical protein
MLTTMALAGAGFGQSPRLINLGGLFQRASIITGFAWLTALSAHALRRTPLSQDHATRQAERSPAACGQMRVSAAMACEIAHKALPRKRLRLGTRPR